MMKKEFAITPADVQLEAVAQGVSREDLHVPPIAMLTFNEAVLDELKTLCTLEEWDWPGGRLGPFYSLGRGWRDRNVCAFFPPMGASPIAALAEDLIQNGARVILLLCGSWGLGEDLLRAGQVHLPAFACGMDGTSLHYGNTLSWVEAEPKASGALSRTLTDLKADWREGGVGCCEAIYRITPGMIERYREGGCLSVENGEVASLFQLAKLRGIPTGVLLQPYIDLTQGWKTSYLSEKYREICKVQARVALEAGKELLQESL